MRGRKGRVAAIAVTGSLLVAGLVVAASAESSVQVALHKRHDLQKRIVEIQETRRQRRHVLHKRIRFTQARLHNAPSAAEVGNLAKYRQFRKEQIERLAELRAEERELFRTTRAKARELRAQRKQLANWIDSLPLKRCPVAGSVAVADNFGVIREMPGTPRHVHQGNDITAPTGTPIVAPFDGNAAASSSHLGGMQVKVFGAGGYVYNAHLSAYGKLGAVKAGDVIGYVGMTGNATAPHDHFEWHPGDGAAVDPFLFLAAVC
ncbi:MAG: peptidoglycan DD-metalloendopeptidase family protein [Actinomycetota bacterium]|nr:peptidoglycan DD-metalloendopeptidase family protein [Actinomycetota bacterium]MDH5313790.1 peptidoglycan DD-metalloendopeptidase family protein [Actinomycetota bacterium]